MAENESLTLEDAELLAQSRKVEWALQAAVRDALIQHKRLGNPIVVWENDQVVWIPGAEIQIYDLSPEPKDE